MPTPASTLLAGLRARGATLTVQRGQLRFRAPRGVLTIEERQALQEHKAELLALLSPDEIPNDASPWSDEQATQLLGDLMNRLAVDFDATPGARLPADWDNLAAGIDAACEQKSWPALRDAMQRYEAGIRQAIAAAAPPAVLAS